MHDSYELFHIFLPENWQTEEFSRIMHRFTVNVKNVDHGREQKLAIAFSARRQLSTMFCGAVLRSKPNQSLYEFVNVLSRISDLRMTFQTLCIDRDRVGAVRRPQIKSDEVGIPGVALRQLSAITGAVAGRLSYRKMNVSPRQTWLREAHAVKAGHRGNYFAGIQRERCYDPFSIS